MKRIVIIGANSYIARNLIYVLKSKKKEIDLRLYDIAGAHADGITPYVQLNVLDKVQLSSVSFDCDILFVFTGKTGTTNCFDEYESFVKINEISLLNILDEYRKQKSHAKIIFPSSRLVYQGREEPLPEDAPKEFKTIYAINKFACEMYLEMYHRAFDVQYCIFRICLPYGTLVPGASSYGTADFMLRKARDGQNITLYGDGKVRRTLTYIEDLCSYLIEGACSAECCNDIYNIGGEDYSLKEMAELIAEKYQVQVEYIDWPKLSLNIESGSTVFDDAKLRGKVAMGESHKFREWILEC